MTDEPTEEQKKKDAVIVSNWALILSRAWSVRFMGLAAVLSAVEVGLSFYDAQALGLSQGTFAAASSVATAAALIARIWAQRDMED